MNKAAAPRMPQPQPTTSKNMSKNATAAELNASDVKAILRRYVPEAAAAQISVADVEPFRRAVTHRSYDKVASYERLEFLGDSVLALVVTAYLYRRYPAESEGFMTRMRSKLVNGAMLADLCSRGTQLKDFVRRRSASSSSDSEDGPDERRQQPPKKGGGGGGGGGGGHRRAHHAQQQHPSRVYDPVMEDVFEAFVGAIFTELGYDVAETWLVGFLEDHVDFAQLVAHQNNPKDVLNQYFAKTHGALPRFEGAEPTAGAPQGTVAARIRDRHGTVIATGTGANRKDAENAAARDALAYLDVPKGKAT